LQADARGLPAPASLSLSASPSGAPRPAVPRDEGWVYEVCACVDLRRIVRWFADTWLRGCEALWYHLSYLQLWSWFFAWLVLLINFVIFPVHFAFGLTVAPLPFFFALHRCVDALWLADLALLLGGTFYRPFSCGMDVV
jgi:hypothetical protein